MSCMLRSLKGRTTVSNSVDDLLARLDTLAESLLAHISELRDETDKVREAKKEAELDGSH